MSEYMSQLMYSYWLLHQQQNAVVMNRFREEAAMASRSELTERLVEQLMYETDDESSAIDDDDDDDDDDDESDEPQPEAVDERPVLNAAVTHK